MPEHDDDTRGTLLDEPHLAAWRGMLTAHASLIELVERGLERAGVVPLGWYDVLLALSEAPERRLRLHELARAVVLSRSGLTRLVDRIEVAGLLRRERSTDDRRGAYAVLTDVGYAALRAAWPVYARGIIDHFARHLSADEAQALTAIFVRIVGAARTSQTGTEPTSP